MWMLHFASESSSCSHGYVFQSCAYISWISSNSSQYLHDIFWNWKDVIFKLCNLLIDLTPSQLYYIEFALFVQKLNKKALISFHNGAYDHSKKWLPINKTIPVIISTVTVLLSCCLQVGSMGSRRVLCLFLIWLLAGWKCSVEATDCVLSLHCPWQHNVTYIPLVSTSVLQTAWSKPQITVLWWTQDHFSGPHSRSTTTLILPNKQEEKLASALKNLSNQAEGKSGYTCFELPHMKAG